MADDQGLPHPDEVEDEVVDALEEAHTSGLERLNRSGGR